MKIPLKLWISSLAGVAVLGAAAAAYVTLRPAGPAFIDPADQALVGPGRAIYMNHCASCHGASLQGQPDWRTRLPNGRLPAPPHDETGHTWHHPDALLIDIVKNGLVPGKTAPEGYVSDMPAYGKILNDEEIIAVLAYIKSTWPSEVRQIQKRVTLQRTN